MQKSSFCREMKATTQHGAEKYGIPNIEEEVHTDYGYGIRNTAEKIGMGILSLKKEAGAFPMEKGPKIMMF